MTLQGGRSGGTKVINPAGRSNWSPDYTSWCSLELRCPCCLFPVDARDERQPLSLTSGSAPRDAHQEHACSRQHTSCDRRRQGKRRDSTGLLRWSSLSVPSMCMPASRAGPSEPHRCLEFVWSVCVARRRRCKVSNICRLLLRSGHLSACGGTRSLSLPRSATVVRQGKPSRPKVRPSVNKNITSTATEHCAPHRCGYVLFKEGGSRSSEPSLDFSADPRE
jgi:hypothetical protein